jgi:hypothetical protein
MGATIFTKFSEDFKWMTLKRGPSIDIYDVEGKHLVKTISQIENQELALVSNKWCGSVDNFELKPRID